MEAKKFIKFISLILVIIAIVSGVVFFFLNYSWTDKFGFKHNVETTTTYETDANATRTYALVDMDKSILDYDDYKLIQTIKPILKAYSDKSYTTFVFGDGTGIYFPCSDINERAFYGEIDDKGGITQDILYYDFEGNTVVTSEIMNETTTDSKALWAAYPEEYKNDSSYATVVNDDAYISVVTSDLLNTSEAYAVVQAFMNAYSQNVDLTQYSNVYVNFGYVKGYVYSSGSIAEDSSILDKFKEL